MPGIRRILPILSLALFVSGCAYDMISQRDRLLMTGRYDELQRHVEAEIGSAASVSTAKLFPLCVAYAATKRYDQLFACCDRLEANIRRGDRSNVDYEELARNNPLIGGIVRAQAAGRQETAGDVSAYPFLFRAQAWIDLGRYDRAVAEAKRALETAAWRPSAKAAPPIHALATLGLAQALAGSPTAALETAARLEAVDTAYPRTLLAADRNVGLARIYLALGRYEAALAAMERDDHAAFRDQVDLLTGASQQGESLFLWQQLPKRFMHHKAQLETGRVAAAKQGYDTLLAQPRSRQNGEIAWIVLFDRGRIAEGEGDRRGAIAFYRQAVEIVEAQRSTINTEASKIGFAGDRQRVYQRLVAALVAEGQPEEAFRYVERAKSRALVDLLATQRDFSLPPERLQEVQSLLNALENAATEARVQSAGVDRAQTRSVIVQGTAALRERAPELASLVQVDAPPLREIQALLPPDETLVEFYATEGELFAFVVTAGRLEARRLALAGLDGEVRRLRQALETPAAPEDGATAARLYGRLFEPLAPLIATENLLIVPHGILHYLPFAALRTGKGYLIDRFRIRLLPSAAVLAYLRPPAAPPEEGLLALGGPALGSPERDLRFARAEALAVARFFPRSRALVGAEATETAFRRYAGAFRYLHLATHGRFAAEAPLTSALLLAPDGGNNGLLTVEKLYTLRLQADLVTLSACETGLGQIAGGDDVVGLTRGFLYAGARSVVASLWPVDDEATAGLMSLFYAALPGGDRAEALRRAQLETRRHHPHPFYWAAFQLTGNAR